MQNEVVQETETQAARGPGRPPVVTLSVVEQVARLIAKGMTRSRPARGPG